MGGRNFAQYNKADPAAVAALMDKCPPCFERPIWRIYLLDVHRAVLDDKPNRLRLHRGECPDYCDDCVTGWRDKMRAAGRCHPPENAPRVEVVGVHTCHREVAARAAIKPSGVRGAPDVKAIAPALAFNSPLRENAPSSFARPMPDRNWASVLCVESGAAC